MNARADRNVRKLIDGKKLIDTSFRGILNQAVHLHTKGKESKDIRRCIELMQNKITELEEFLASRNKNV